MNAKNTKNMIITEQPISDKIEGESLEQVQKFKYLGTQVTEGAKSEVKTSNYLDLQLQAHVKD